MGNALRRAEPARPGWALGLAGCASVTLQLSVIFRYFRLLGAWTWLFWTYPVGSLITAWALIGSLGKLRSGAKVVWKSTAYTKQ